MFVEKSITEIVEIEEEVKILGINLQKSGLPITFDSLGKLWEIYGEKHRYKMKHAVEPVVEYAVALNKVPDYIAGCAVTEIDEVQEGWASFILPKGKYIKDSFNAETFEQLVTEKMSKRDVKKWAKENKCKVKKDFSVEVYPIEAIEGKNVEMYTLTPLLD